MVEIFLCSENGQQLDRQHSQHSTHLLHEGDYPNGAKLVFVGPKGFLWVQVDAAVAPALVYVPQGTFTYNIPQGESALAYPPTAFAGERQLVRAWLPTQQDLSRPRNLALNPADQRGEVEAYPHATANVETRNEAGFAARNVIDGYTCNTSHGEWPYQSWGIGAREDAWCRLDFGRLVEVTEMALILRADFPHDAYWVKGSVLLSDGDEITFDLQRVGQPQRFALGKHKVSWMKLEKMIKSDDPSAFPALTEWEVYGTEVLPNTNL